MMVIMVYFYCVGQLATTFLDPRVSDFVIQFRAFGRCACRTLSRPSNSLARAIGPSIAVIRVDAWLLAISSIRCSVFELKPH